MAKKQQNKKNTNTQQEKETNMKQEQEKKELKNLIKNTIKETLKTTKDTSIKAYDKTEKQRTYIKEHKKEIAVGAVAGFIVGSILDVF